MSRQVNVVRVLQVLVYSKTTNLQAAMPPFRVAAIIRIAPSPLNQVENVFDADWRGTLHMIDMEDIRDAMIPKGYMQDPLVTYYGICLLKSSSF